MKATTASEARVLTDIPNIGKSIAGDLRGLGVNTPADVAAMDPIAMYDALRTPMGAAPRPLRARHLSGRQRFYEWRPRATVVALHADTQSTKTDSRIGDFECSPKS